MTLTSSFTPSLDVPTPDKKKSSKLEFSSLQKTILVDSKKKWIAQIELFDPKFNGAKSKELTEWRNDEAYRLLKFESAFATDPRDPDEYKSLKKVRRLP